MVVRRASRAPGQKSWMAEGGSSGAPPHPPDLSLLHCKVAGDWSHNFNVRFGVDSHLNAATNEERHTKEYSSTGQSATGYTS
jgi:hypothetical protein